ncbi:MAG: 3-hydroxybutyryl-CoA dehydrogenase, partial [Elusimicrobia bacterium]|nr:3-hydroxybutyryl-CoA dehydrogenase [Elusimicrobiota bacterium]
MSTVASEQRKETPIRQVAVVGSGQMGNGIAHVFASAGFEVLLVDVRKELVDDALAAIRKNMERQVAKNSLSSDEMSRALDRIRPSILLEEAAKAQIVIEAVPEKLDLKKEVFARLDRCCPPAAVLATNTSSLSITALAAATRRAPQVIGMHFMNPVPVMKLVEIIRGLETSEETYLTVRDLVTRLGKEPVESRDYPGFISNRILMPMINEACFALMEGVAKR